MAWIFALGLILILVFVPSSRMFFLVLLGLIILLMVGLFVSNNYEEGVKKSLIPLTDVQFNDLRLLHGGVGYELGGEVKNNSSHNLWDVYLKITAYDCPEKNITQDCVAVGEDDNIDIAINIPPNQVRAMSNAYVSLYNLPNIKGQFLWKYEITGTRGN